MRPINRIISECNIHRSSDQVHKQHLLFSSKVWSIMQTDCKVCFPFSRKDVAEEVVLTASIQVFFIGLEKTFVIRLPALNHLSVFQKQMGIRHRFEIFICYENLNSRFLVLIRLNIEWKFYDCGKQKSLTFGWCDDSLVSELQGIKTSWKTSSRIYGHSSHFNHLLETNYFLKTQT